jgi:hypothetical protein
MLERLATGNQVQLGLAQYELPVGHARECVEVEVIQNPRLSQCHGCAMHVEVTP